MRINRKRKFAIFAALLALFVLVPAAWAHPLGNFTISRYSHLTLQSDAVKLLYIIDMAEIPTFQERPLIDQNGDGSIDDAEETAYASQQAAQLAQNLSLTVNGQVVPVTPDSWTIAFPPGQGELATMRFDLQATAVLPPTDQLWQLDYHDNNFPERLGWQETVVTGVADLNILQSSVPTEDVSNQLRSYPEDLLQAPLAVNQAQVQFALVGVALKAETAVAETMTVAETAVSPGTNRFSQDEFANLLTTALDQPGAIAIALVVAFGLGAAHALTPGHGKTIVGAYLVGSRGTPKHALFLGLTTTVTHTAGVFAFGLLVLFASRTILPEMLYPWLGVLSGLLVVGIGFSLFQGHLRSWLHRNQPADAHDEGYHTHFGIGHSHTPKPEMGWHSLLALGVSGGLLPCPSALILLLSAVALQKVGFGLILIVAFSIGLASVLTGIGLAMVYAGKLFSRLPTKQAGLLRLLPAVSALFITIAGIGITVKALLDTGVL
ncbi:MAG: sulfite exporter TauE/SafE family protein [Ardenticatenaceae bacterium]|nr:sulfite exporter TauE/SafE family protein [Ardenticatenaceae bacterium]MCB8947005.1 sulfite exporter TauE/SafE family protein [Ardenticatenaceae bacterium]